MRYKKRVVIFILFVAFLFVYPSCVQKMTTEISLPEGKTAEIIFLVGEVFITSQNGAWIKAKVGDILEEGVKIKTSENSYCEIVINSGTIFRMKDRSELQLVMLPSDERNNKSFIYLDRGNLFAKIQKLAYTGDHTVQTSSATLGVRGTEFLVHTEDGTAAGYTEILIARGAVRVKMNIQEPSSPFPHELKPVINRIQRGVKVRGGFKVKIPDQKVLDLSESIDAFAQQEMVDAQAIDKLKQDAVLQQKLLDQYDKRRMQELEEVSLEFQVGETLYISPNFDGIQDKFIFDTGQFTGVKLTGWRIVFLDGNSKVIKVLQNRISEDGGLIELPEIITWNLVDEHGNTVRDGSYVYEFYTSERNKKERLQIKGRFIVDTLPPKLNVETRDTTFSPNEDGIKDTLIMDIDSETGIEWACVITTPEGITVKTMEWESQLPSVFEWDGKGENGNFLPEGIYNISISGQDRAGNYSEAVVKEIALDVRERSATVDVNHSIFSPNGDKKLDTVTFYPVLSDRNRIDTWDLIVQTEKGETAKRFRGRRYIPLSIEWDGSPQKGVMYENLKDGLPTGKYYYFLKVIYRSGVNTYSFRKELIIDNEKPFVDVEVTPRIFSPDGDGENDVLYVRTEKEDLTKIIFWKVTIYTTEGHVFKTFSGSRSIDDTLMWDGVSDTGRLVDAGEDYYLVFEAVDSGLNTGVSEKAPFSVDILVVATERGLKIRVSNIEFGFNNAELQGEKTFKILDRGIEVLNKYGDYSILIEGHTDSTGDEGYNRTLSLRRAESVGEYLIQNGINPERLSYEGYGSQYPIDSNETPKGRARNRRVEFILIKE